MRNSEPTRLWFGLASLCFGTDDRGGICQLLPRGSETLGGNNAASRRRIAPEGVGGTLPRCVRRPVGARSSMAKGKEFLQELREFLAFLASLWGLLAAVSVFFPLSNLLTKVVPLGDQDKPFHNVSPALVALLTTLSCIFLTFATFGRRFEFADDVRRGRYAKTARWSFVSALVLLALYVLAPHSLYEGLISGSSGSEGGVALYDGLLAALYIASFALITRAFLLLAMLEYFPQTSGPAHGPTED